MSGTKGEGGAEKPATPGGDSVADTGRALGQALDALLVPGSGAISMLECRVAGLEEKLLATPARSLADVAARLAIIRRLVAGLGEPGYLLHLVDATLADVQAMQTDEAGSAAAR